MPNACISTNPVAHNSSTCHLAVGGLTPLTTIDYPGQLSAVIFCQGCPWRCHYCHNPHLIERTEGKVPWAAVEQFLIQRQGLLDAVVFSGGEPTLQRHLPQAMTFAKALGYNIGLHTSGATPQQALRCLPLVDWVGLDIKQHPDMYDAITGRQHSHKGPFQLLEWIIEAEIDYEVRITTHPTWMSPSDLEMTLDLLQRKGAKTIVLQKGVPPKSETAYAPVNWQGYDEIVQKARSRFHALTWRE